MHSSELNSSESNLTEQDLDSNLPIEKQKDPILKVSIGGIGGVGKTTLCKRALEDILDDCFDNYKITIGVQFFTQQLETNLGNICLCIWDLAGQVQFQSIVDRFLKGSKGVILAYDCSNIDSYFALHHTWIPLVKEQCAEDTPILLVSTKNDLNDEIEVDEKHVREFIDSKEDHNLNIIGFYTTSAKENINVQECFSVITDAIIEKEMERAKKDRINRQKQ
jgi:small GTP-binding protein